MKNPNYKGIELLPLSVIEAAAPVMPRRWNEYCGTTRATSTSYVPGRFTTNTASLMCVWDEYMKRRLEIKAHFFHRHDTVTNRPPEAETA